MRAQVYTPPSRGQMNDNVKDAIWFKALAWNAAERRPGQHQGPLTAAYQRVLYALLYVYHNRQTGLCIPSRDTIAKAARCSRDTVRLALHALEAAGILTWVNRIKRVTARVMGRLVQAVIKTSNAYVFEPRRPKPDFRPLTKETRFKAASEEDVAAAQRALARIAEERAAKLWSRTTGG